MGDSVDLDNTARQIAEAQQTALRCLKRAYYSQNGRGAIDTSALREGESNLQLMERLIGENLPDFVEQINASSMMQSLIAAGVSYEAAAAACKAIMIYQAQMAIEAAKQGAAAVGKTALRAQMENLAIGLSVVVAAVAFAFFCHELYNWLTNKQSGIPEPIKKRYEDQINGKPSYQYRPFEGRMIPGRAG